MAITVAGLGKIMIVFNMIVVFKHDTGAAYIVLSPEYAKPTHRGARTTVFIGLGLCAIVPTAHLFLTHDFNKLIAEMGVNWLLTSGALYIGGALL